jgi:hypothetical protein
MTKERAAVLIDNYYLKKEFLNGKMSFLRIEPKNSYIDDRILDRLSWNT